MNVYFLEELCPGNRAYDDLRKSLEMRRLVPIIGSGFSCGLRTRCGRVPSSRELQDVFARFLEDNGCMPDEDIGEFKEMIFRDAATCFAREYESAARKNSALSADFRHYVVDNFTKVDDLSAERKAFLKCDWPYLYTLNYDDAIESTLEDYDVLVPFRSYDSEWLRKERRCIIKLHGDAQEFQKTGDLRYLTMSQRHYAEALGSDENSGLLNWLCDDFLSKDVLFVGCSLDNEIDLVFADVRSASKLPEGNCSSYYVYYDREPDEELTFKMRNNLCEYGITNIIRVPAEQIDDFFEFIVDLNDNTRKLTSEDDLARYRNYSFSILDPSNGANQDYLFSNAPLRLDAEDGKIELPSFAITRTVELELLEQLEEGRSLSILMGNRFSGKTYVMLGLLRELKKRRKDVYYFNTVQFDDEVALSLSARRDCILLFDSDTLTSEQIKEYFCYDFEAMKNQGLQVVCAASTSDRGFFDGMRDELADGERADLWVGRLGSRLDASELKAFNEAASKVILSSRRKGETFLDYAIRIDEQSLKPHDNIFPSTNMLSSDNLDLIASMIALAVLSSFDSGTACLLNIQDELGKLCTDPSGVVQRDYLSALELSGRPHSGAKYIANSKYWLCRCLTKFASNPKHYDCIARTYEIIASRLLGDPSLRKSPYAFRKKMKPYIFLDHIQELFFCEKPQKGSLTLPEQIYEKLSVQLRDDYQFLHQRAKCKLRVGRHASDDEERIDALDDAKRFIERALELADSRNGSYVAYTLTHMSVTKALILTNYLRYCCGNEFDQAKLAQAIKTYHYIFVDMSPYVDEQFTRLVKDDMDWFFERLANVESGMRQSIRGHELHDEAEEAISAFYDRHLRVDWPES